MDKVFQVASDKYYKDAIQTVAYLLSPHTFCGDPRL